MKLNALAFANATALVVAVVYVVCVVTVALFPEFMMSLAQSWFHGLALSPLSDWQKTPGTFVLGLVSATGLAWAVDYIFAIVYNRLVKS